MVVQETSIIETVSLIIQDHGKNLKLVVKPYPVLDNWSLYDVQHAVFQPKNMTPDELFEGNILAWEKTYSTKNILSRISRAGTNIPLSLITNLGYRYYGKRLRRFTNDKMISLEAEWNRNLN